MIEFRCTCGKVYQLADEAAGKKVRCQHCQTIVDVPTLIDEDHEAEDSSKKKKTKKRKPVVNDNFTTGDELLDRVIERQQRSSRRVSDPGYRLIGLGIGVAITPIAIILALLSGGAGHGSYSLAWVFYPYSMFLASFAETIGALSICLAFVQWPIYGLLVGWFWPRSGRALLITVGTMLALHLGAMFLPTILGRLITDVYVHLHVSHKLVVGNELRIIVDAVRMESTRGSGPFSRGDSKKVKDDAQAYLIVVDLASSKPSAVRMDIYGPLVDVPSFDAEHILGHDLMYSKMDLESASVPALMFETDGTVLKFTWNPAHQVLVRDALDISPNSGHWKRYGDVKEVDNHIASDRETQEDCIFNPSQRFMLVYRNGSANLFDLFSGERKTDTWLTKSFAQAQAIKGLGHAEYFLTEDLNHLVVLPKVLNTPAMFEVNGGKHYRDKMVLTYTRPDSNPKLFARKSEKEEYVVGAYSIDGTLFLLWKHEANLRLSTPDEKKEFKTVLSDEKERSGTLRFLSFQHSPDKNELILLEQESTIPDRRKDHTAQSQESIKVRRWNYKKDTITDYQFWISDMFDNVKGRLQPRNVIEVK